MSTTPVHLPRQEHHIPPLPSSVPDKPGLCGLTSGEWHMVLIFLLFCECGSNSSTGVSFTGLLMRASVSPPRTVLIALLVALVVAGVLSENIFFLWLQVLKRVETTRMSTYLCSYLIQFTNAPFCVREVLHEELFKHALSDDDVRNPLITPGSSIARRHHPIVNFILSTLFSLRGRRLP
jgi:hypothetical protein